MFIKIICKSHNTRPGHTVRHSPILQCLLPENDFEIVYFATREKNLFCECEV